MPKRSIRLLTLLVGLLACLAAAPARAEDEVRYDRDPTVIQERVAECGRKWPIEHEREVGGPVAEEYDRETGTVDWPDQVARVEEIVRRLEAASDRPDVEYNVKILDDPLPNAMAIPGGYIRVTTGLLQMVQSDHELAGVLAHEMAHNCLYHGLRQVEDDSKWEKGQLLAVIGVIAGAMTGALDSSTADLQNLPYMVMLARVGWLAGYSRRYEYEADWSGLRYMTAAGYDPSGFYTFMKRLINWEFQNGWRRLPEEYQGWDSHPPTQERLRMVSDFLEERNLVVNRANVCRGFVASAREREVAEGRRLWEVRFGDLVIFQPSDQPVGGLTPQQRAEAIASQINLLVARRGIGTYSIKKRGGDPPSVVLHNVAVIEIHPEDAKLVGLTQEGYLDLAVNAFLDAIYDAEKRCESP